MTRLLNIRSFFVISLFCLLFLVGARPSFAENSLSVISPKVELTEEGYSLSAQFSIDLPQQLQEILLRGVPLYFSTELEISRSRTFWFDEKPIDATRTTRIAYNVLTRQYSITVLGSIQQQANSLEEALNLVMHPQRWVFAKKDQLKEGKMYSASIRILLDTSYLPKPFQINVINNSYWRLSSEWTSFSFNSSKE